MSGRPEPLFPLFAALDTLEGVGPKTVQNLAALDIEKPRDMLFTLPYSGIDRRKRDTVQGAELPGVVTVEVTVGQHRAPSRRGGAYRVTVEDAATAFQLVFFHARDEYLGGYCPRARDAWCRARWNCSTGWRRWYIPIISLRRRRPGKSQISSRSIR